MLRTIFTCLSILFLISCHKPSTPTTEFGKNAYPLVVGNWWRYQVTDIYSGVDTLTLSVISGSVNGYAKDYKCTIYRKSLNMIVDTGHFILSDTALYYNGNNPNYSYFGFFNLKLPFTKEQKWPGIYANDTFTSVGIASSLKILGNSYGPVYTLHRVVSLPHYRDIQFLFITPNVGIINQSINIQIDTSVPQEQGFQLIDYKLN